MLTRLKLRNFKSWADTGDIPLKPITGLFGANSSGKTSLLQALLLLMQTATSSDRSAVFSFGGSGSLVELGDFRGTVYRHTQDTEMEISLDWHLNRPFQITDPETQKSVLSENQLGFTIVADSRTIAPRNTTSQKLAPAPRTAVNSMSYRVGSATFGMSRKMDSKSEYDLFPQNTDFEFKRNRGRAWPLPAPGKCYGFPDQVWAYYQNAGFLADLALELETRLKNIFYLGPLRAYPERTYTWAGEQPSDMGQRGESAIATMLASRARGRYISPGPRRRKRALEEHIAHWLKELGLIHDFRIDRIGDDSDVYHVKVEQTAGAPEVLITDVGFGVSQILPVLTLCFYVPEGSTVILEQPEIHLHPAVQSGLADVLIDAWKTRKIQILLESHSEHLLRRLQRRIAEEKINESEVGLFFCNAQKQRSEVTALDLNIYGHIENWPRKGFFGDELIEVSAMMEAEQKRRIKEKK